MIAFYIFILDILHLEPSNYFFNIIIKMETINDLILIITCVIDTTNMFTPYGMIKSAACAVNANVCVCTHLKCQLCQLGIGGRGGQGRFPPLA